MRWPVVWGAAAAGLAFLALFFSDGSSQSRMFWVGVPAVLVAAVGWAWRRPRLPLWGFVFFCALAAFVVWQGVSIAWSIQPSRSWTTRTVASCTSRSQRWGRSVANVPLRRFATVACVLLGALFVWALAAKVIPGIYPDYERLARFVIPLGYWNALALLSAASVPLGLWAVGPSHDRRARLSGALFLFAALVVRVLTYSACGDRADRRRCARLALARSRSARGTRAARGGVDRRRRGGGGCADPSRCQLGRGFAPFARSGRARVRRRARRRRGCRRRCVAFRVVACRRSAPRAGRGCCARRPGARRARGCCGACRRACGFRQRPLARVLEPDQRAGAGISDQDSQRQLEQSVALVDRGVERIYGQAAAGNRSRNVRARRPRRARLAVGDHGTSLCAAAVPQRDRHRRLPVVRGGRGRGRHRDLAARADARVACACSGSCPLLRAFVGGHRLGLHRRPGTALPDRGSARVPALRLLPLRGGGSSPG